MQASDMSGHESLKLPCLKLSSCVLELQEVTFVAAAVVDKCQRDCQALELVQVTTEHSSNSMLKQRFC